MKATSCHVHLCFECPFVFFYMRSNLYEKLLKTKIISRFIKQSRGIFLLKMLDVVFVVEIKIQDQDEKNQFFLLCVVCVCVCVLVYFGFGIFSQENEKGKKLFFYFFFSIYYFHDIKAFLFSFQTAGVIFCDPTTLLLFYTRLCLSRFTSLQ